MAASSAASGRIRRAAPVEVGAHGEHDRRPARGIGGGDERVDERDPLVLVAAERERLLELVDGDDQAVVRS